MAHPRSRLRNRIKELRSSRGEISQRELAERVGVSRQTLNAIEGAKYSPSLEVAFRIAEVLGTELTKVFQHEQLEARPSHRRRATRH